MATKSNTKIKETKNKKRWMGTQTQTKCMETKEKLKILCHTMSSYYIFCL
jgi:hypothetical protein